jgi:hypothetical protein
MADSAAGTPARPGTRAGRSTVTAIGGRSGGRSPGGSQGGWAWIGFGRHRTEERRGRSLQDAKIGLRERHVKGSLKIRHASPLVARGSGCRGSAPRGRRGQIPLGGLAATPSGSPKPLGACRSPALWISPRGTRPSPAPELGLPATPAGHESARSPLSGRARPQASPLAIRCGSLAAADENPAFRRSGGGSKPARHTASLGPGAPRPARRPAPIAPSLGGLRGRSEPG